MKQNKWLRLGAIAVAMIATACGGNQGFRIEGKLENQNDKIVFGDTVFLSKRENGKDLRTDTALVQPDGTFCFEGQTDSTNLRLLVQVFYAPEGRYRSQVVYVEKGVIKYHHSEKQWEATGTPLNDAYTQSRLKIAAINDMINEASGQKSDNPQEQEALDNKYQQLVAQSEATLLGELAANAQTPVVMNLLIDHQMELLFCDQMERLDSILKQIPEPTASTPIVAVLSGTVQTLLNTSVGKPFTDFEMPSPKGEPVKLSHYVGKKRAVLVDFWASWCGPCRASLPGLKEIYAQYRDNGFEVVGVSLDGDEASWKQAIADEGLAWPQMSDLKGWSCQGAALYGVRMIPATILIDEQGIIVGRNLQPDSLRQKIEELLK